MNWSRWKEDTNTRRVSKAMHEQQSQRLINATLPTWNAEKGPVQSKTVFLGKEDAMSKVMKAIESMSSSRSPEETFEPDVQNRSKERPCRAQRA